MKKVDDYTEAKLVIMDGVDSKYYKKRLGVARLRALLVATIGAAAATALGFIVGDPVVAVGALPVAEGLMAPLMAPYFISSSARRQVKNGTYFDKKSQSEVIDIANKHLREEEEYNKKQEMRGKAR